MTSINTNSSAMAALQTLQGINNNLSKTQAQISSGLRVGSASDNAAYWSIATTMRSDNDANSAISDALGLGSATADTAYQGMNSAIDLVTQIQSKLVAAQAEGVDKTKINGDIKQLQSQLGSIVESASFSGENWLQGDTSAGDVTKNVLGSFVRDSSGVSVKTISYTLDSDTLLIDTRTDGGTKQGILDATTDIEDPSVTLNVSEGGQQIGTTLKSFTTDDIITLGAGASTFDGNHANDGTFDYVKVDDDTWVQAVDAQPGAAGTVGEGGTQEVAYTSAAGTEYYIDTSVTAGTGLEASVSTFQIGATTSDSQLNGLLSMVDSALTKMTSAAASLGSISSRIDLQTDFVSKLSDSVDSGVGKLVDADMEAESSKLTALQTQPQLAIQSLSIANSSSQNILSLFR